MRFLVAIVSLDVGASQAGTTRVIEDAESVAPR